MVLKHVFFILARTCLIMANIANATSMNDRLNNNIKLGYDLAIRLEASGGLTECWNTLMEMKSCSNEIVIFFLNSQDDIGLDCCRAIDIITLNVRCTVSNFRVSQSLGRWPYRHLGSFLLRTSQILDELYQKSRHSLGKALVEGLHHREGTTWSRVGCRIRGEPNRWAAVHILSKGWLLSRLVIDIEGFFDMDKAGTWALGFACIELGPWGPLVLIIAYVPLTVLAIPASILTLGGGYLFGLPLGVIADSVGATAAFLIGRTVSSSTPAH
ncbi:hypothetical protein CUMW_277750, partial [Citrus unshiu]